jgi:Fe2+ transport system protein B
MYKNDTGPVANLYYYHKITLSIITKSATIIISGLQASTILFNVHRPGRFSRALGRLSRRPVFGIPILPVVVFVIYLLVVNVSNAIAGWINQTFWIPVETKSLIL